MFGFNRQQPPQPEHVHEWGTWSEVADLEPMRMFSWGPEVVNDELHKEGRDTLWLGFMQYRTCTTCGLTQQNVVDEPEEPSDE